MSIRGYWPDEQREQMRDRARRMRAARSSWISAPGLIRGAPLD